MFPSSTYNSPFFGSNDSEMSVPGDVSVRIWTLSMSAKIKALAAVRRWINLGIIYLTWKPEDDEGVPARGIHEFPSALTKPFQARPSTTYLPAAKGMVAPRATEYVIVVAWPGCRVTDPPPMNTGVL